VKAGVTDRHTALDDAQVLKYLSDTRFALMLHALQNAEFALDGAGEALPGFGRCSASGGGDTDAAFNAGGRVCGCEVRRG